MGLDSLPSALSPAGLSPVKDIGFVPNIALAQFMLQCNISIALTGRSSPRIDWAGGNTGPFFAGNYGI
jgi:hypothetical protein